MLSMLRGRQTQFYIDIVYGIAFSLGFGYLLFVGMDVRVAAFQGGLVLGYFLRVWENMSVYERVLQEEVAAEAESQVASEVEQQVDDRVSEEVEAQVDEAAEDRVAEKAEERVAEEAEVQVAEQAEARVAEEVDEQVPDTSETEALESAVADLLEEADDIDDERVEELRSRIRDGGT
ncbi:MAG: hypothetical protein ACOCQM_07115 [Natronomonas sp.]